MSAAWFSALTALAVAVAGVAAWALRWAWRILKRTTHFLDDFFGEPARDGLPAAPGVMARLRSMEQIVAGISMEVHPNSGHSLRDIVHQTASDVAQIRADQGEMRRRMELFETQRASREDS